MKRENPVRVTLRVVNDMLHDIAAGAWPGATFALWMAHKGAAATLTPDALDSLTRTWSWILTVMLVALVVQVATGLARLGHRKSPTSEAVAKHVVFTLLFVAAVWAAFAVLQV